MAPKFRAWDKGNKIYLYNVQYAYDMLSGFVKYDDGEDADYDESCFGDFLDNKWYDVEQYTGMKDINGKPIYGGDIVELDNQGYDTDGVPAEKIYTGKIDWESGGFDFITSKSCDDCNAFPLQAATGDDLEVIGNIHQNPGLLEAPHE